MKGKTADTIGGIVVIGGIITFICIMNTQDKQQELNQKKWLELNCPVYKSECGPNHKYACELKVFQGGSTHQDRSVVYPVYKTC